MDLKVRLLMIIPSLPILAIGLTPEYWGIIYLIWGAAFACLSMVIPPVVFKLKHKTISSRSACSRLFLGGILAWVVSFIVLSIINLTPLCLGQDNGDGVNDLAMCLLLTVIWPVFMSIFILPLIGLASYLGSKRIPCAT